MIISKKCLWAYSRNILNVFDAGKIRNYVNFVSPTKPQRLVTPVETRLHVPVLVHKVADFLQPEKCELLIDMTFGSGGHTRKLLERSQTVKILCLDRDPIAYHQAVQLQKEYPRQIIPLLGKFSDLPALMKYHGYGPNSVDGILMDFGTSSMQFDDPARGFALNKDGPLDMRMDGNDSGGVTAADVLAHAHEVDLQRIFRTYGEEKHAKKIARAIVETRLSFKPLTRTSELRDLVAATVGDNLTVDKMGRFAHASTKVFLALRIFVNNELNEINFALTAARKFMKIGAVMVTLSFHALEDAIVKDHIMGNIPGTRISQLPLKFYSFDASYDTSSLESLQSSMWKSLSKHVIVPSHYEVNENPRSRSVKLRACLKVD